MGERLCTCLVEVTLTTEGNTPSTTSATDCCPAPWKAGEAAMVGARPGEACGSGELEAEHPGSRLPNVTAEIDRTTTPKEECRVNIGQGKMR